jgi:hypothetical protein
VGGELGDLIAETVECFGRMNQHVNLLEETRSPGFGGAWEARHEAIPTNAESLQNVATEVAPRGC